MAVNSSNLFSWQHNFNLLRYNMKKNSKIAVIIPFYNGSKYIERAIISVLEQTVKASELIVVNDGSSKNEHEFISALASKYDFKLIHKENGGQGSARNRGVAESKSKYICFLDQDDFYISTHNETLIDAITDDPHLGFVYADLHEADGDGNIVRLGMVKDHADHPKTDIFTMIKQDMFVLPSASLIIREAFDDVAGFDEQFTGYEDDDLFLRLVRKGYINVFVDKPVTTWCINEESTSYSIKMSRSRFKYFEKLSISFPDAPAKSRFFMRDLFIPRFGPLFIGDYITALKNGKKNEDINEYRGFIREFMVILRSRHGINRLYKFKIFCLMTLPKFMIVLALNITSLKRFLFK